MGEAVWALTTAEGDSVALSEGFVAHSAAFPVAVKFMVDRGYEENPGFNDGDVYVSDDGNDPQFIEDILLWCRIYLSKAH